MKKIGAALLSGVMLITLLAGCQSSEEKETTASTAAAASKAEETEKEETKETEDTDETAAESKAETSGEEVTIKVSLWDYSNVTYYKTIFAAFEEANPNIKIDPIESSSAEYDDLIQVKMSSNEDLDVVFTKGTPALSGLVSKGHMLALDDYIKDSSMDLVKFGGLVEQMQLDGEIFSIPFRKDNNMIFYNKDLFDAAGVEYPTDGMTMDEYRELAKKMTSGEGSDKVYGAHVHTWSSDVYQFARRMEEFVMTDDDKSSLLPYYETILAMQNEDKSVMDYGSLKASSTHYSGVFYNQEVAMMRMGTWFINMLVENADFNWGGCSIPNMDGIGNTQAVGGVTPVGIGAYAKNADAAWEFIKFACEEEGALVLAQTGILPGYASDKINEIFDSLHEINPGTPDNLSTYIDLDTYIIEQPMHEKGREITKIIDESHDLIMTNSVTPEEGLQEMTDRINELLNQ